MGELASHSVKLMRYTCSRVISRPLGQRSIRTPAWLRLHVVSARTSKQPGDSQHPEDLFAKNVLYININNDCCIVPKDDGMFFMARFISSLYVVLLF